VLHEHRGGAVLVIASGEALPQMVRELAGQDLPPGERDDPDLIYVVSIPTFGRANLVRLRL
jgi:hypothetical protein